MNCVLFHKVSHGSFGVLTTRVLNDSAHELIFFAFRFAQLTSDGRVLVGDLLHESHVSVDNVTGTTLRNMLSQVLGQYMSQRVFGCVVHDCRVFAHRVQIARSARVDFNEHVVYGKLGASFLHEALTEVVQL